MMYYVFSLFGAYEEATSMRISTWVMVLVAVIAGGAAWAATWAEYERSDLGYQLDFPGSRAAYSASC